MGAFLEVEGRLVWNAGALQERDASHQQNPQMEGHGLSTAPQSTLVAETENPFSLQRRRIVGGTGPNGKTHP